MLFSFKEVYLYDHMFIRVNSACRVIQYCIQLCQDHFSLSFESILQESDSIHHFFMDAILFEADVYSIIISSLDSLPYEFL